MVVWAFYVYKKAFLFNMLILLAADAGKLGRVFSGNVRKKRKTQKIHFESFNLFNI